MKSTLTKRDRIVTDIAAAVIMKPDNVPTYEHMNRPCHCFAYSFDGGGLYEFVGGETFRVQTREMIYLPRASNYYATKIAPGSCGAINFHMLEYEDELPLTPFKLELQDFKRAERLFQKADKSWQKRAPARMYECRAVVTELFAIVKNQLERPYMPDSRTAVLEPAVAYIDENFTSEEISITALAAMCGISEVWFRRLFSARFGVTPSRYIMNRRIERASELIASRICSIESAGAMSGFPDPAYFSRVFKAEVGMSPTEFRDSIS